jgi:hypothetical protein
MQLTKEDGTISHAREALAPVVDVLNVAGPTVVESQGGVVTALISATDDATDPEASEIVRSCISVKDVGGVVVLLLPTRVA